VLFRSGNINATTYTGSNILVANGTITNLQSSTMTSGSVLFTNLTTTNLTSGSLNVSTVLASTNVSSGALYAALATVSNVVATALSCGSVNATGLTTLSGSLNSTSNSNTIGSIITTGGNIGIGTTSPISRVSIVANSTVNSAEGSFNGIAIQSTTGQATSVLYMGADATNDVSYIQSSKTGSNLPLVLNNRGGNVGINTSSPSYPLHVNGAIYSSGDITAFSDRRLKTNIIPLENCLEKIQHISGVSFTRIDSGDKHIGLIAQEVEEYFPDLVYTDNQTGYKSIAYGNTIAVLLESIKELTKELNNLKNEMHDITIKMNEQIVKNN